MAFRNLRAIIGPLELPIGDKTYSIPPLPAEWGIRLRLAAEGAPDPEVDALTPESELELFLGPALAEMRTDLVPSDYIELALLTALAEFNRGRPAAERTWEAGPNPNLIAAMRAAAVEKKNSLGSQPSSSSAKASKIRSPASTPRTTSRQATPRGARKTTTARASAGPK